MADNDTTEEARRQAYNRDRLQDRQQLPTSLVGEKNNNTDAGGNQEQSSPAGKFRQLRNIAKQQQEASEGKNQNIQSFAKNATMKSAQKLTAEFLRDSWINLIPSFGLTLAYLNFHLWQQQLGGFFPQEWFVPFGTEWTAGKSVTVVSSFVGFIEIIGLILIDVGLMLAIIIPLAVIMALVGSS